MRSRWSALFAASLLLATAAFLAGPSTSQERTDLAGAEHPSNPSTAPAQAGATLPGPRTELRHYAVLAGTSAAGAPNCTQDAAPAPSPAVDAACFHVHWPENEQVTLQVTDDLRDQVFVRASFHDSGGLHLKTRYLCSGGTLEVPIWAAELRVWLQPAWAGALNELDEHLDMAGDPCEPEWGTAGTVTAVFR